MDSGRLRELADEIKRKSSIAKSIPEARNRQLQMLPSPPTIAGYDFDCRFIPCSDVSGDFYDFVAVNDMQLGITIGDVSGHGIEAAIIMGMAKKALQIYARGEPSAKQVLSMANDDLSHDLLDGTFVSAAYGILDIRKRIFNFSRAGNNPPFLINPARNPVITEIKPNGLAIGVDKTGKRFNVVTQEVSVQLRQGDLVFIYTDGLSEASSPDYKSALKNSTKEEYGIERLKYILQKNYHLPIPIMLATIENAVRDHCGNGDLDDDVTMIAFKVMK